MILTGTEIRKQLEAGKIILDPFHSDQLNPNSYNYRLGPTLKEFSHFDGERPRFKEVTIAADGYVLKPKQMYLGSTLETIGSSTFAMSLIGRSSLGRLGLFLQVSANLGHVGSCHRWTLELVAAKPIRLYPGMIIGQVSFWVTSPYADPYSGAHGQFNDPHESELKE